MKTPAELRELLSYDPSTGEMTWHAVGTVQRIAKYAGKPAFTSTDERGYKQGRIDGAKYYAHRVAWALATGAWPIGQIDHINGDRADNRLSNLREATSSQNGANRHRTRGSSKYLGVSYHKKAGKWQAYIQKDGHRSYLGLYQTETDASRAYRMAAAMLHGEYAAA